jgi:hypothetical protein
LGVPASPSGHSPKGGAAKASPAKPSVPNAVWRVEDRSANMFNIVEGKDYFDKTIIAFTANGVGMEYANLIAAAPELYEALDAILSARIALTGRLRKAGNAALAQARGESQ